MNRVRINESELVTDDRRKPEKTHVVKELSTQAADLLPVRSGGPVRLCRCEDDTVQRWDLNADGQGQARGLRRPRRLGLRPGGHTDGKTLLSGGGDGKLIWWPATADEPKPMRPRRRPSRLGAARRRQPRRTSLPRAATTTWSGSGRSPTARPSSTCPATTGRSIAWLTRPTASTLVSADLMGLVIEWDVRPGKEARRLDAAKLHLYEGGQGVDYGGVRDLSFSRDGVPGLRRPDQRQQPAGRRQQPGRARPRLEDRGDEDAPAPQGEHQGRCLGRAVSSRRLLDRRLGRNRGGFLWFWKPDQDNEFFKFALPNTARDLDLHPDGIRLATAHHDGMVRISAMKAKA